MTNKSVWTNFKFEMEFLNKYPILLQATTDNESPIPGYLFGEITALTYVSNGAYCEQLVAYFMSRAQTKSHAVQFKALKMLLHLAKNGQRLVLEELKLQEVNLKEISGAGTSSQDHFERSRYENIRRMSKELLTLIFAENPHEYVPETSFKGTSTGYGAQASVNKLSGFGNVSNTPKNIGDRMADSFADFVDKILSPTSEKDFYKKQATVLNDSLPQYQPVTIEKNNLQDNYATEIQASIQSSIKSKKAFVTQRPVHVPGHAGGGWDDSDDEAEQEEVISLGDTTAPSLSVDSLENKKELPTPLEYVEEQNIVENFAVDLPLEKLKYEEIVALCKKCASLNCDKVLEFLIVKFAEDKEKVRLRCLILIEYLLHQDIVNLESLTRIALPMLKHSSESERGSIQLKSKKICLIIECMSKTLEVSKADKTVV